eukprot:CAMPEP_0182510886 /NCGR_PEP_ID=MMETSP1321-20130603/29529_1 /TAXON_ID=91990 /ORGANISM="Bolidomonas sp., Strain RCC1657" /LENGTH=113 /DNA_ID=CAMNT_0024717439 /DNA_START=147 /DNA_END=485 /DNA_ORIENTATION=+
MARIALTRGRVGTEGVEETEEGGGDERGPRGVEEVEFLFFAEPLSGRAAIVFRASSKKSLVSSFGCEESVPDALSVGAMTEATVCSSSMSRLLRMEGGSSFTLLVAAPGFVTI